MIHGRIHGRQAHSDLPVSNENSSCSQLVTKGPNRKVAWL